MLSCLVVSYTQRPSGFKAIIKSIFKTNLPSLTSAPFFNNNNNNNNIYSGSSTHRSVFQGGPVIYIYIIHGKLYYAYLKTIKYLQMDYI